MFAPLISGDEASACGDKAYGSTKNREYLDDLGIKSRLIYKAAKNKPLKSWQLWFNKVVSSVRAAVEGPFSAPANSTCALGARPIAVWNGVRGQCFTFAIAYNLNRALALV